MKAQFTTTAFLHGVKRCFCISLNPAMGVIQPVPSGKKRLLRKLPYRFVFGGLIAGLSLLLLGGIHSQAKAQESAPRRSPNAGGEGTVTCSIQDGSGYNAVFRPYRQYNCGRGASGVGTGDFNHDGQTDVALSTSLGAGWTHELLIFLQDGNGGLGQPTSYAGGNRSEYLGVGDFNHDGWDDVVTADYDNTISVYLQQADGTLANRVTYPTNTGPDAIAIADVNNDTWDEIIVSHWNSPTIGVFTQKVDGTLNAMVTYPSAQAGWDDIEAGDVNGDGRADVVKMNGQGYVNANLMVYLQNEAGTLDAAVTYRIAECPVESPCNANGLGVGDVTGDGREDVILTYGGNGSSAKTAVFQQDTNGALLPSISYPSLDIPDPVEVADIDSDSRLDVVVLHSGWVNAGVYTQQATGELGTEALYAIPYKSWYASQDLHIADVNTDGFPDLLIADGEGLVVLYHRTPAPTPLAPAGKISDTTPTYQWNTVSGATQYRYELLKGTTPVYTETVLSSLCDTTCSSTPSTPLGDAAYKWRVQALFGSIWGDYSPFKSFSVDAVPTPLAPSASTYDPTPTYKWTKVVGASQYRYQLMRGTAVVYTRAISSSACGATTCSATPTTVLPDGSYKWKVQAMIDGLWGNYSPYKTFGIKTIPTPRAPAGTIWDAAPTFKWSKIPGAGGYRFQVMRGATLIYTKTVGSAACTATTCSNTPATILGDSASYKWRVQAIIGGVARPYSAYKAFTIPSLPEAGFWRNSTGSLEFYVTTDHSAVDDFAIRVYVYGCGAYKITHTPRVPIANNHFSFSGSFYGNGTFGSNTTVSGSTGLSYFYIPGCGYVSGGPFSYSAGWSGGSQPLVAVVDPDAGVNMAEIIQQALDGYYVIELDTPAP